MYGLACCFCFICAVSRIFFYLLYVAYHYLPLYVRFSLCVQALTRADRFALFFFQTLGAACPGVYLCSCVASVPGAALLFSTAILPLNRFRPLLDRFAALSLAYRLPYAFRYTPLDLLLSGL